eukprot:gene23162-30369_t
MDGYEYNCTPLRSTVCRDIFKDKLLTASTKLVYKTVPPTLFRGVRLYPDGACNSLVAFFTSDVGEAVKYSKFHPHTIYKFCSEGLRVLDMTHRDTVDALEECARLSDLPDLLISLFISTGTGANVSVENDMFHLIVTPLHSIGVHGVFRSTLSSTIGSDAYEFCIFRESIPEHIK